METALSTLDTATLQTWLSECLTARQDILASKRPYSMTHAGQTRSYNHQHLPELDKYIGELMDAIKAKSTGRPPRGPIHHGMGF